MLINNLTQFACNICFTDIIVLVERNQGGRGIDKAARLLLFVVFLIPMSDVMWCGVS